MTPSMIQILAENNFFYVIDKPAGLSVHNASPSVSDQLKQLKKPEHFVNRLDLETSGLMIVAQKPEYHEPLSLALSQGVKTYRTLLRGVIDDDKVTCNKPLTDQAEGRKNPQGVSKIRFPCKTDFLVLRTSDYLTEADAIIHTGRQHQIRKHAALMNHAIVGDKRYNEDKYNEKIFKIYNVNRMFLHARKIEFKFNTADYIFESTGFSLDIFFNENESQED